MPIEDERFIYLIYLFIITKLFCARLRQNVQEQHGKGSMHRLQGIHVLGSHLASHHGSHQGHHGSRG